MNAKSTHPLICKTWIHVHATIRQISAIRRGLANVVPLKVLSPTHSLTHQTLIWRINECLVLNMCLSVAWLLPLLFVLVCWRGWGTGVTTMVITKLSINKQILATRTASDPCAPMQILGAETLHLEWVGSADFRQPWDRLRSPQVSNAVSLADAHLWASFRLCAAPMLLGCVDERVRLNK